MSQTGQRDADDRPKDSGPARGRETKLLGGVGVPGVPQLSLPAGGGSIRGIGEKFQASSATGTATVTVPVGLSPGRAGVTPDLALSYDSGHGNGPCGIGWTLGVHSIARRTDKRLPRYVDDGPDADVFVLSGAEDLVPALRTGGPTGMRVDEEELTEAGVRFHVRRYRPRVETTFARIERWTGPDAVAHWRVTSRDNQTTVFGATAAARVADPADPRRVFEWLAEQVSDDRGNLIAFEYLPEDIRGVDEALAHESNRVHRPGGAGRLLKRVCYANAVPHVAGGWLFEWVVDYGDHATAAPRPEPDRMWAVRPDPYSRCRAGFEVRCWRRASRLLMFHRFPELGPDPVLVRSVELGYADAPTTSLLTRINHVGWATDAKGATVRAELAPITLTYSQPEIDPTIRTLDPTSAQNLPIGLSSTYTLVDLDGEGLAGMLTDQAGGWFYKRNHGHGQFGPATLVAPRPEPAHLSGGGQQLLDLDGDGRRSLVSFAGALPGYVDRCADAATGADGWSRFVAFDALPGVDLSGPDVRFVDLTGDGRTDVLIAGDEVLTWYPSEGQGGFGEHQHVPMATADDDGPRLVFRNAVEAIHVADMSGDGLPDLVRIRASEVCYWPALGYGRFGPKVTMSQAPTLAGADEFDPRRVRLSDVDGTGPADVLYLHRDGVRLYLNGSGNSFGPALTVASLPHQCDVDEIAILDLTGSGTADLVWSTPLPADAGRSLVYVDLMTQGKPLLLRRLSNNLGAHTELEYTPSSWFYRADAEAGRPWVTTLPFVVQCLSAVTITDETTGARLTTRYRYHHGYYDHAEREFRGFAYVEHVDAEELGLDPPDGSVGASAAELLAAPVLTREWFHTGVDPARGDLLAALVDDAYADDPDAPAPPGPVLPGWPDALSVEIEREAHRALRAQPLRTEVYGLDDPGGGPGHPYTVTQHQSVVRLISPPRPDLGVPYGLFYVHHGQTIEARYERNPADPRVTHHLTLQVDEFGTVLAEADVAYPRRPDTPQSIPEQRVAAVTATRRFVTNRTTRTSYRLGVLYEAITHELTGLAGEVSAPVRAAAVLDALDHGTPIEYLDRAVAAASSSPATRRAIEHVRVLYRDEDLRTPLPLGHIGGRALVHETYLLALTGSVVDAVYGADLDRPALAAVGGYVAWSTTATSAMPSTSDSSVGAWWLPSGQPSYDPARFYQSVAHRDPFGHSTTIAFDVHALTVATVVDPVGLTVTAQPDYRTLTPSRITDANGDTTAAAYDALHRLVGTALLAAGDSLDGFIADPPQHVISALLDDPLGHGNALLGTATTRVVRDLTRVPAATCALARERHADPASPVQVTVAYTDGLGRELMRKVRAAPGPAPWRDDAGTLHVSPLRPAEPRWVGTGRTVLNNKGMPVRRYEPFFTPTHRYETEPQLVEAGVTAVLRYDPPGRLIRTDNPDGTYTTVSFTPWTQVHADANDNVRGTRWLAQRLGSADAYEARSVAVTLPMPERRSSATSIRSAGSSGRLTTTRSRSSSPPRLRHRGPPAGRHRRPRANGFGQTTYDMVGTVLRTSSVDSGMHRTFTDVLSGARQEWTARGMVLRHEYDQAHRPTQMRVAGEQGLVGERIVVSTVWGDTVSGLARLDDAWPVVYTWSPMILA